MLFSLISSGFLLMEKSVFSFLHCWFPHYGFQAHILSQSVCRSRGPGFNRAYVCSRFISLIFFLSFSQGKRNRQGVAVEFQHPRAMIILL